MNSAVGAIPSAFDCFLVNRGLKTLPLRMRAHCENAMAIATFLEAHPKIRKVVYPGLVSHPHHEIAKKQTPGGFSGMVTAYIKSDKPEAATKFVKSLKIFILAESLGGNLNP